MDASRLLRRRESTAAHEDRVGVYSNVASAYHLGRALSAVFGGLSASIVAFIYALPGGIFILPTAGVIAWHSYRQLKNPSRSPVGILLADSFSLVAAIVLLRPPTVLLIGPIAVIVTAAMLMLPWHQTMAMLVAMYTITWIARPFPAPLAIELPADLVALLTPMLAAAYLPSFIVLLRGVGQVLTDRQTLNDELARRLRYEHALASCSQALLASSTEQSLDSALESLLDATHVDAIVVGRNVLDDDGRLTRDIVSTVTRSTMSPHVLVDQEFFWDRTPAVRDELKHGRAFFYTPGTLEGEQEQLFVDSGITSDLIIPIGVNGEWAGYISFTDTSARGAWTSYDRELLPSVARMIGAHWTRLENAERLEAMINYKDEFIASVSHELRTPLTAVVGFAEELRDGFDGMEHDIAAELIDLITDQSLEVAHIVEDLLVVARLGSDELTLVPEEVCALTEADAVVRALGMAEQVEYSGGNSCYAVADSGRYRQVVRNLLTNARRYGGDQVVVHVSYTDTQAILTVKDDGDGVPQSRWEQIFQPYERMRQPGSTPGSVGLGLTVSRQLARLMGGDLEYRYRGGWSEFILSVPISQMAFNREPVA